jgi:hypothetical protein
LPALNQKATLRDERGLFCYWFVRVERALLSAAFGVGVAFAFGVGCLHGPLGPSAASISWEKIKTNFKVKSGGQECPPHTVI